MCFFYRESLLNENKMLTFVALKIFNSKTFTNNEERYSP